MVLVLLDALGHVQLTEMLEPHPDCVWGRHGRLSREEMLIPWLAVRLDACGGERARNAAVRETRRHRTGCAPRGPGPISNTRPRGGIGGRACRA